MKTISDNIQYFEGDCKKKTHKNAKKNARVSVQTSESKEMLAIPTRFPYNDRIERR